MNFVILWLVFYLTFETRAGNQIIDDADPSFGYAAVGGSWNAVAPNRPCSGCTQFDPSQTVDKTWHDTTGIASSATVSFKGTSATLFGICPQAVTAIGINGMSYNYFINGGASIPQSRGFCNGIAYRFALFSFSGLDASQNSTVTIVNGVNSVLLIDYLQYDDGLSDSSSAATTSSSTSTASPQTTTVLVSGSSTPLAAIVAPLTVIIGLLILAVLFLWWRMTKRASPPTQQKIVAPAMSEPSHSVYTSQRSLTSASPPPHDTFFNSYMHEQFQPTYPEGLLLAAAHSSTLSSPQPPSSPAPTGRTMPPSYDKEDMP